MVNIIMLTRMGLLAIFLIIVGQPAFAECSGVQNNGSATINLPSNLPVNSTIGTVLYDSGWVSVSPHVQLSGCTGNQRGSATLATPGQLDSGNDVYKTSISGIGIATYFTSESDSGTTGLYTVPASNGGTVLTGGACTDSCGPNWKFRTQLVVTGPISAGSMTYSGAYATAYWSGSKVGTLTLNGTTNVVAPTCDVQTTDISVNLPNVSVLDFPSVGATAGRTTFNIGLNCTGSSSVGIIMTDANNTANTTQNLTLNTGGASGTALQIISNNQAVTFGQPSPFVSGAVPVNNPAMVKVGRSQLGNWAIPFSAQYIRTGAMTAGTAVAKAVFVMTYQ